MNPTEIHIHDHLVEGCRKGERSAQFELYRLYAKAMYNVSYRILLNREESEDILQEAFTEAFIGIDKFRGDSSFGSWLKRIVVNKSINAAKKRKMVFADLNDHTEFRDEEVNESESAVPDGCTAEMIKENLSLLPDGFRLVFSLYMLEDWSHKDIAKELGITESTSKSQLNRAKKKLAELIKEKLNVQ